MMRNRFLLAGLVLGGMLGAAYAARYMRRQPYGLSTDPLLGWRGEGRRTLRDTALPASGVPLGPV